MDKKALLGFKKPNLILNFIFLAIVVFVVVFFISSFFTIIFDTADAEVEIMAARVLFSPNGLSYCDDRCYPGIVDYKYFGNDSSMQLRMNKAFNYTARTNPILAFHLSLFDSSGKKVAESSFNEEWYKRWSSLTSFKQYKHIQKDYYVLYRKENSTENGRLSLDMVMEVE
jgi:hypothetical protein